MVESQTQQSITISYTLTYPLNALLTLRRPPVGFRFRIPSAIDGQLP